MKIIFDGLDITLLLSLIISAYAVVVLMSYKLNRLITALRLIILLFVLLIISNPKITDTDREEKKLIAVAFDTSRSMDVSKRLKNSVDFFKKIEDELSGKLNIKLYSFSNPAQQSISLKDVLSVKPGTKTDLFKSLWEIKRDLKERLSGIIVFSDGNHNGEELPEHWIQGLDVPLFTVDPGSDKSIVDLTIEEVRVSDFAFKNVPLDITAKIRAVGLKGKMCVVNLKSADKTVLYSKTVYIDRENNTAELQFSVVPRVNAKLEYTIEAEPQKNEITLSNNTKKISVNVLVDKIRVLFLCGQPGPEYAFLRHYLKNDPMVELVSFVILRNPENITLVSEEDLALIPFPVHEIFTNDLNNFDVLIFENFTHQRFGFFPQYLENIRNWVMIKGGGFIMTGGKNSFYLGGWANTPVADILPCVMDSSEIVEDGLFKAKAVNTSHEIMKISDDEHDLASLWAGMPELDGCQSIKRKKNTDVLLENTWSGSVVLACSDAGKGRVAALGTDTTWRWALADAKGDYYSQFWKNMLRYVSRTANKALYDWMLDKTDYYNGQDFMLKIRPGIKDVSGISVIMVSPDGIKKPLDLIKKGADDFIVQGKFENEGRYVFEINAGKTKAKLSMFTIPVIVKPSSVLEDSKISTDTEMLKNMASNSKGKYFNKDTFDSTEVLQQLKETKNTEIKKKSIFFDSSAAFLLLIFAIICEWILRKFRGLW